MTESLLFLIDSYVVAVNTDRCSPECHYFVKNHFLSGRVVEVRKLDAPRPDKRFLSCHGRGWSFPYGAAPRLLKYPTVVCLQLTQPLSSELDLCEDPVANQNDLLQPYVQKHGKQNLTTESIFFLVWRTARLCFTEWYVRPFCGS